MNNLELHHLSGVYRMLSLRLSPTLQRISESTLGRLHISRRGVAAPGTPFSPTRGCGSRVQVGSQGSTLSYLFLCFMPPRAPSSDGSYCDPAFPRALLFPKSGTLTRLRTRGWGGKSWPRGCGHCGLGIPRACGLG